MKLPNESDWYICYVNEERLPLLFNQPNQFWVGVDGKIHPINDVEWIDDSHIHLDRCNLKQDWSEAFDAFSSTPNEFRNYDWEFAYENLIIKSTTCNCKSRHKNST